MKGLNGSAVTGVGSSFGLTFSIDSSVGAGNFVIVNGNEIQNTDTSAAGQGQFLLRCTDAGNPQVGTTTGVINVVFDEPNTNFSNYQTYPAPGFIGDASGAALYFTNNYTGLTNNIPSSTFSGQGYNSSDVNTFFYLKGLKKLTSSQNPYIASVCDPSLTLPGMFLNFPPGFYNYKADNALSTGAFYIYFNPRLSQAFSGGTQPQINIRYQIAYRSSSSSAWSTAIDMNGNPANFSGTWFYSFSKQGLDFSSVTSPWSSFEDPQIVMVKDENNSTDRYAGLVYAFDQPGEYRVLHSNIITTFGSLTNQGFPTSPFSCSGAPYVDGDVSNIIETGDFYYPSSNAGGDGDQIGGQPNDSFYRYRISQGSCGSATPITNVYAREPLAKYVSQFFVDTSLTIPYGTSTSGTSYVFRRMESNTTGSNFLNPEYTNDGKYQVFFQNTQGVPSSISPCYY